MFARTYFDDLTDFRRSFDQIFENFYNSTRRGTGSERTDWAFSPAVETGWTDDHLNLRVVLPGVQEKDMKVTVQGNQLLISGERRPPEGFGKEGSVYTQLAYGRFDRTLDLPNGLDLDKMQAYLHDGVLDIRIPLAQAVKPKQIKVATGETKTLAA